MSKSKGNVINPDDYFDRYGVDVVRVYLMFFGNYQDGGDFRDDHIAGVERFLERLYRFRVERELVESAPDRTLDSRIHVAIRKVTRDIESLRYNTAIAAIMELFGAIEEASSCPREGYLVLLELLAPFAPFLTQELWTGAGEPGFIASHPWPEYDESRIVVNEIELVIQVNGRLRDRVLVSPSISKEEAIAAALARPRIVLLISGREVARVIFVPGKLVNLVTSGGRG
jgi:leucyl-tRNA synthetase